jgi:hypothetical protein
LILRVSELGDDFPFYQLRIRDHVSCAAPLEQGSLQFEYFTVFVVQETKRCAPGGFMADPALEPKLMKSIAGSIAVTLQHAVQTEQNLIRLPAFLNGFRET